MIRAAKRFPSSDNILRGVTFQPDVISKFRLLAIRLEPRNIETLGLGTSGGSSVSHLMGR